MAKKKSTYELLHERFVKTIGCWLWTGSMNGYGYGRMWVNGKQPQAHRLVYEAYVGPIPDGLVIDHLCRVTRCVNPAHLEPVTTRENFDRGYALGAIAARTNRCMKGHEFTADNTLISRRSTGATFRKCRRCRRFYQAVADFNRKRRSTMPVRSDY